MQLKAIKMHEVAQKCCYLLLFGLIIPLVCGLGDISLPMEVLNGGKLCRSQPPVLPALVTPFMLIGHIMKGEKSTRFKMPCSEFQHAC